MRLSTLDPGFWPFDRLLKPACPLLTPHLRQLGAESIEIMREVVAQCANPVFLYSIGKDSTVVSLLSGGHPCPGAFRR